MKETVYISSENVMYQLANLRQITFEVTDACNLNCRYCAYGEFYNDYAPRENKMMPLSVAYILIDYLAALWSSPQNMSADRNVYVSFYGGEPLLNMTFIESVVSYIKNRQYPHRSFTFTVTTNALLLHRCLDYLVKHDFKLHVSLDGNEYNTSYRVDKAGNEVFKKITENMDFAQKKYPEYFEKKVSFTAVLHNRNSVGDIYDFFKKRYYKIPAIAQLNTMGIRPDKLELFRKTYRNSYESLHEAENYEAIEDDMFIKSGTYRSLTTFLHQYSDCVYRDYTDLLFGKPEKTIPTGTCLPFGKKMFVTVNGKILPCERIGHQFELGSVSDSGVNLDMQAIADRYNAYFSGLNRQCEKCYNAKTCIQCVFNLNELDDNPVCHGFMDKQAFDAYKSRQMDFLRQNPEAYYRIMEEVIVE